MRACVFLFVYAFLCLNIIYQHFITCAQHHHQARKGVSWRQWFTSSANMETLLFVTSPATPSTRCPFCENLHTHVPTYINIHIHTNIFTNIHVHLPTFINIHRFYKREKTYKFKKNLHIRYKQTYIIKTNIYKQVCQPIFQMITDWIYKGQLENTHHEVFNPYPLPHKKNPN